ncbi:EpsG family protein [Limosilactobacillus reuteri]|uniref:EpsG family protein n=2 Tax=Limosilactobacillus reuteri TaxID=1598 RepID=A0A2T5Q1C4_LIMRT|nr:EpsG family protein [Limosilactobacillus reuteri]
MLYIFLVSIGIILSLCNLTNNRIIKWMYTIAVLITMIYLMGTVSPYHSFDTSAYQFMYSLPPISHRFESGYMHLSYFFYVNGSTYETFRICSYALFVILMFIGVLQLTSNTIGFYSLYLIFPFFLDVTQVRQFFMFSLVVFGIGMLCTKSKLLKAIGVLSILISPLFQMSGIIYYLLLILTKVHYKKLIKIMNYLIWILPIVTLIIHYAHLNKVFSRGLSLILSSRSNATESVALYTQGSSFSVVILYILSIMISYFMFRNMILKLENYEVKRKLFLTSVFLIGILSIPLLASSSDFERFIRNSIFALIIVFSVYMFQLKKIGSNVWIKNWGIMVCILILVTSSWKYWDTSVTGRNQFLPYIIKIKNPNDL